MEAGVAVVARRLVAAVEVEPAVRGLHRGRSVGPPIAAAADVPARPVIVAVDDVRVVGIAGPVAELHDPVVAGDHQPPAAQLDAVPRSGGVPRPLRQLHLPGDLARRAPGRSVIIAAGHPHGPGRDAGRDLGLVSVHPVAAEQQPDGTGLAILHRGGIAAHPALLGGHHLNLPEAAAPVVAAAQKQVDLVGVATGELARLVEGQDGAPVGGDQRRNPALVVTLVPGPIEKEFLEQHPYPLLTRSHSTMRQRCSSRLPRSERAS